ncbi:YafY family transcriptional regulator [Pedobacter yulinensis]|uniref:YafY family transcriptional regulator n=1 Tax=Pedobacter yulinensis TaxID=2126353 RepID=A0A2T3HNP9_9SPHI|nr:YafY family protein [Pedobacter yulinensis]PST84075.1 YafY family transcriptional regulator [Pedobacter yulinensis]
MNRIDRLFGLLTYLQSRKHTSAEQIAEKFGMSLRTVYRDMRALNEQGVPVAFEPHKGYFIASGYFLPPITFNMEEANALLLVESLVNGFADRSIKKHYGEALSKVKNVLKASQKEVLENMNEHIRLQLPGRYELSFEYLSVLQAAISAKKIIELCYTNRQEEQSTRRCEPIGIIFYAFGWHLIAWCHMRREYRDFSLVRIRAIRTLELDFTRSDHMHINDYMKLLPVNY